jgi:hypothetical protein
LCTGIVRHLRSPVASRGSFDDTPPTHYTQASEPGTGKVLSGTTQNFPTETLVGRIHGPSTVPYGVTLFPVPAGIHHSRPHSDADVGNYERLQGPSQAPRRKTDPMAEDYVKVSEFTWKTL